MRRYIKKQNKGRQYTNNDVIIKIEQLINLLEKKDVKQISEILNNKKTIITRNLLAGIIKGIGTGIGFTILTAIIIYILQKIIRLNIPIIGEYINDILDIVEQNKK